MRTVPFVPLAALAFLALAGAARADVVEVTQQGFLLKFETEVGAPPEAAYKAVTDIGKWWNPAHTWSGSAANLSLEARPGGCFCEKLPEGGVQHMTVVFAKPGALLRLAGGLGPLQGSAVAGSMGWQFAPAGAGTKISLVYAVGGYMQGGFEKMAGAVNTVLAEQLGRLKNLIDTGAPAPAK